MLKVNISNTEKALCKNRNNIFERVLNLIY